MQPERYSYEKVVELVPSTEIITATAMTLILSIHPPIQRRHHRRHQTRSLHQPSGGNDQGIAITAAIPAPTEPRNTASPTPRIPMPLLQCPCRSLMRFHDSTSNRIICRPHLCSPSQCRSITHRRPAAARRNTRIHRATTGRRVRARNGKRRRRRKRKRGINGATVLPLSDWEVQPLACFMF